MENITENQKTLLHDIESELCLAEWIIDDPNKWHGDSRLLAKEKIQAALQNLRKFTEKKSLREQI